MFGRGWNDEEVPQSRNNAHLLLIGHLSQSTQYSQGQ